MVGANGVANGAKGGALSVVFPEALTPLQQADPEVYAIIEDEKVRQWCVARDPVAAPRATLPRAVRPRAAPRARPRG
jgi:hypothetical protein